MGMVEIVILMIAVLMVSGVFLFSNLRPKTTGDHIERERKNFERRVQKERQGV